MNKSLTLWAGRNNGIEGEIKIEKQYMNTQTGSVDSYAGWWYENEAGQRVNAVDLSEVVEVVKDENGDWVEA